MNDAAKHIKALEGFRGICILLVLLHNLFPYEMELSSVAAKVFREFAGAGWVGVQWFFVLSGFLITRILISAPKIYSSIKYFYIGRCLRIFPLYYFILLVLLVILPALGLIYPGTRSSIEHAGWFWFYISNLVSLFSTQDIGLSHFWSLAVEEQFYLVWPWLIIFLSQKHIKAMCVLLVLSAAVIRACIAVKFPEQADTLNYVMTFVRWDALALGALLAMFEGQKVATDLGARFLIPFIIFLTVWFLLIVIHYTDFKPVGLGVLVLNQTLAALFGVVFIFITIKSSGTQFAFIKKIFESKILCHFGKYSYAIYIFHLIVAAGIYQNRESIAALIQCAPHSIAYEGLLFFSTLLIIYCAARISWQLIELPFLKAKTKFQSVSHRS